MRGETKMTENQKDESVHSDLALSAIVDDIKQHLGLVLVAEAGHGKSFTAFSIVKKH